MAILQQDVLKREKLFLDEASGSGHADGRRECVRVVLVCRLDLAQCIEEGGHRRASCSFFWLVFDVVLNYVNINTFVLRKIGRLAFIWVRHDDFSPEGLWK